MKIIIAGGREFNNYKLVKQTFQDLYGQLEISNITIISGCARGADALGIQLANELGCNKLLFPANWTKYGKKAGYMRNEEMAQNADALLAFWDGNSRGTMHMINIANMYNIKTNVIKY